MERKFSMAWLLCHKQSKMFCFVSRRYDCLSSFCVSFCVYYLLYSSEMSLRCFFGGLRTVISSPIITLNFQCSMRVIQPVTSLGCFGHTKMAANFGLNQPTSTNGWKSSFRLPYAKKKFAVFPSKVETLLLSKNLTYKNFVSVAL